MGEGGCGCGRGRDGWKGYGVTGSMMHFNALTASRELLNGNTSPERKVIAIQKWLCGGCQFRAYLGICVGNGTVHEL